MRRRGLLAVPVGTVALPRGATTASAADSLKMYRATVDDESVGALSDLGVDLSHTGYKPSLDRAQTIFVDLLDEQAEAARATGLALHEVVPGPHVSEPQIAQRARRRRARPRVRGGQARDRRRLAEPVLRRLPLLLEPGGIEDEMTELAAQYRGLAKLVVIGQSGQGQPIVALKVTQDARNVPDGERPAMLFSAVNHAREWIAAEVGRRMPRWWLEHADDPAIADVLGRTELWFLPIQNPDGYDYTFTCGVGFRTAANQMCGATLVTDPADPLRGTYVYKTADGIIRAPNAAQPDPALRIPTQRLWRKTVRDNDGNGIYRRRTGRRRPEPQLPDRVEPRRGGREQQFAGQTYRGPCPLSETEDLAYDRLLRKITPEAVINYHSAAQLLLYPFGYITDVYADDDPWFKAITGTDGDAAVDPYISQRSSDLYITNGETTDHAYNKYGSMTLDARARRVRDGGRRHVLHQRLRLHVPRRRGQGRGGLREEPRLRAQRRGDDARPRPSRPPAQRDGRRDPVPGQGLAGHRAEPVRRLLRRDQTLEATARRILGPVDFVVQAERSGRRLPHADAARHAVDAAVSASATSAASTTSGCGRRSRRTSSSPGRRRPAAAGGRRHGQRPRHRGLAAAAVLLPRGVHAAGGGQKRVLVVAAEDYTGLSPNKTPYDTAPRYLDEHVAALTGQRLRRRDVRRRRPPAGPNGAAGSKLISDLGVLSHFDAVLYYTGDDLLPQASRRGRDGRELPPPRHPEHAGRVRADRLAAPDQLGRPERADAAQLHERRRQGRLRGPQRLGAADEHQHRPEHVLGLHVVAGPGVRLRLPAGPGGRRRPSAHGVLP